MTNASSAISRGGNDSGVFISVYTTCFSTDLVDGFDSAISGESITTVVSATADDDDPTCLVELDTCRAEDLRRRDVRFSSTGADNASELKVFAARVGSTFKIGAVTKLVTVAQVGGCNLLDEVALDGTGKLAFTDTSRLEIDGSTFESPAVVGGCGFRFYIIDTVNDGSVNHFDDSKKVLDKPEAPGA